MKDKLRALYAVKDKLQALAEEYGPVALVTWFAIFFATLGAFYVAIESGFTPEGAAGRSGTVAMAYGATQLTKPLRAVATFALTPLIARSLRLRRIPVAAPAAHEATPAAEAPETP
jgi:hypothetical protein